MSKHARYSPSKLADIEACPCWTESNEKDEENEAAIEGTMLHKACETGDFSELETSEQLAAVKSVLAYIEGVKERINGPYEIRKEVPLKLKGLTYGTADVLILDKKHKRLHILDAKFVRTSVSHAEHNLQTAAYGAAALERFPSYHTVITHIVAPRIPDYTSAVFGRDLLIHVRERIDRIILAASYPFKKPVAGEQCRFCGVKAYCPALRQTAVTTVNKSGLLPVPESFNVIEASPEDKAKVLLLAKVLVPWATEVKRLAVNDVLEHGSEIPGFSLRRRAGSVSVRDQAAALEIIERDLGIHPETIIREGLAKLSVAQLASHIMENHPVEGLSTKKDYVDLLVERLGDSVSEGREVVYLQKDRKPTDSELMAMLADSK